ncbi:pentatricopeptide repeat-containing protein [Skeletonema marinoi]|uniref:Pentatricopeptide repeat-containing protein n=1 Tax=Skeletonema marinoi TaxID=267567 RepID=A0AAD8YHQ3_9STRA|nr:pentatricopeptide repeat-containing protein [Skeletonema marinoi]
MSRAISLQTTNGRNATSSYMDPSMLHKLEMEESAIVPDVIFCNTLMNAYAKMGDYRAAKAILNSMLGAKGVFTHEGIPKVKPTAVTYNTLADACKVAGELGAALDVPELMISQSEATGDKKLLPDLRTYTTLISTVARKSIDNQETRDIRSGGEKDPDMAFALLNRMKHEGIVPNDQYIITSRFKMKQVRGQLQLMLVEKRGEQIQQSEHANTNKGVGRGVTVHEGCGIGALGSDVHKFDGCSLELSQKETRITKDGLQVQLIDNLSIDSEDTTTEAIFLFKQLMRSLLMQTEKEDMILKVFLVFQEMKNVGMLPDVAMYNSLLRASQSVLRRMEMDGIVPNRGTLKEAVTLAKNARRSEFALSIWATMHKKTSQTVPLKPKVSVEMMGDLMNNYASDLQETSNHEERIVIHREMMNLYQGFTSKLEEFELHDTFDEIACNLTFLLQR